MANQKQRISSSDRPLTISSVICLLFAMTLPFNPAFSINMGFPLKLSDMLGICLLLFFVLEWNFNIKIKPNYFIYIYCFIFFVAISYILNVPMKDTSGLDYRGGRTVDGLTRLAYLFFNLAILGVVWRVSLLQPKTLLLFWLYGTVLAVGIHLCVNVVFYTSNSLVMLPSIEQFQFGTIADVKLIRSGLFREGNFAGLYYFISCVFAVALKKWHFFLIAALGLLMSLSTLAVIGLCFFCLLYFGIANKKLLEKFLGLLFLSIVVLLVSDSYDLASKLEYRPGQSMAVRLNQIMTGLLMWAENPFFGVGLGGYGFYFEHFEWRQDMSSLSVAKVERKTIPNNVFTEILAECGIFAFISIICFYFSVLFRTIKHRSAFNAYSLGLLTLPLILSAYPTFNITFLWVFFGIVCANAELAS